jgi:hypothetical protein
MSPTSKGEAMADVVWGVVRQGVVIPETPLPEGTLVQVVPVESSQEVPPELRDEFAALNRASDKALELVERLAQEGDGHAEG